MVLFAGTTDTTATETETGIATGTGTGTVAETVQCGVAIIVVWSIGRSVGRSTT